MKHRLRIIAMTFSAIIMAAGIASAADAETVKIEYDNAFVKVSGNVTQNNDKAFFKTDFEGKDIFTSYYASPQYGQSGIDGRYITVHADAEKDSEFGFVFDNTYTADSFTVSYDICPRQTNQMFTCGMNGWFGRANDNDASTTGIYFGQNGKMGYAPHAVYHSGNSSSEREYSANEWYHFDSVYNLAERTVKYYLNGTFWGSTDINSSALRYGVKAVNFQSRFASGPMDASACFAIDNVVLSENVDGAFSASYTYNEEFAEVRFSQSVSGVPSARLLGASGEEYAILKSEYVTPQLCRYYFGTGFDKKKNYILEFANVVSVSEMVLSSSNLEIAPHEISVDALVHGKSYSDLMSSAAPMEIIKYHNQFTSLNDGSFSFEFSIEENGLYDIYISDEIGNMKSSTVYCNNERFLQNSDFEDYIGGKPNDWTRIYGSETSFSAVSDSMQGNVLSMNAASSVLRMFKSLPTAVSGGAALFSFDFMCSTYEEASFKLMKEYVTSFTGTNEEHIFDVFNINKDGYMGFYPMQKESEFLCAEDMKYETGIWYNAKIWIDFNFSKISLYINDKLIDTRALNPTFTQIQGMAVALNGAVSTDALMLDNIQLQKLDSCELSFIENAFKSVPEYLNGSLGIFLTTAADGNVFYDGECRFDAEILNRSVPTESVLRYEIFADGKFVCDKTENVLLTEGINRINLPIKLDRYGILEIRAKITDGSGKTAEYKTRFCVVRSSNKLNRAFGINNHSEPSYGDIHKVAVMEKNAGFGVIRSGLAWDEFEKEKGVFEIPDYYSEYNSYTAENGIIHLMTLGYDNPICGVTGVPKTDAQLRAFAEYASNIARTFSGQGKYYEIWNEYVLKDMQDVEAYVTMMSYIYPAVKANDTSATVLGIVAAHTDYEWIEEVIVRGAQYMDGVSIHKYVDSLSPEEGEMFGNDVASVRAAMNENGMKNAPLWMSEYGWTTSGVSEQKQAQYLVRAALENAANKYVDKIIAYNSVEKAMYQHSPEKNYEYHYGILQAQNTDIPYEAKAALPALACMNAFVGDAPLTDDNSSGNVSRFTYSTGKLSRTEVIWSTNGESNVNIDTEMLDALYDMYGNELSTSDLITVDGSPVYAVYDLSKPDITFEGETILDISALNAGSELSIAFPCNESGVTAYAAEYSGFRMTLLKRLDLNTPNTYVYGGGTCLKIIVLDTDNGLCPIGEGLSLRKDW